MRIRWLTPDPAELGLRLAEQIGAPITVEGPGGPFDRAIDLPSGRIVLARGLGPDERLVDLELVGHRRAGREAVAGREPGSAASTAPVVLPDLLGVGWATVDLDRAALAFPDVTFVDGPPEQALGARTRLGRTRPPGGPALVLLEPSTEGPIAASLARFGEGPAALYVAVPADRLAWLADASPRAGHGGRILPGPFGRSVALPGARRWGPHLVVCEARPRERRGARPHR